ncbi:MAG: GGDEF domain-containing protein, partial [Planctomycetales bacterium]|nr:GGDEF domain-containing protein [Planctomycetales bacterium]
MVVSVNLLSIDFVLWVVPGILISIGIGVILGRIFAVRGENTRIQRERAEMLKALQKLVQSAEQLSNDVDSHNCELANVGQTVCDIDSRGDFEKAQAALLTHIAGVIESNRRMEDDLVVTRYRLEEQAQELDRTRVEARVDALSGVGNRKAFDEALQFMISNFKRHQRPFALLLADVDHFKRINDTHGHAAGDRVVQNLGNALREFIRPDDFVGRYGGDEFAVLFSGLQPVDAENVCRRIRSAIERKNFDVGVDNARLAVTLSMGLTCVKNGDNTEAIFK